MKRVLLLLLLMLARSTPGSACSCVTIPGEPGPPEIDTVGHDPNFTVFVGTVEEVRFLGPTNPDFYGTTARFSVDRYWGGATVTATFEVETGNVGGGCGVRWQPGECYYVEAWVEGGKWKTSTCSDTTLLSAKPHVVDDLVLTDGPGTVPAMSGVEPNPRLQRTRSRASLARHR